MWVAPENSRLQVWMPPASLSKASLLQVAEETGKLRQAANVKWIDDPVQSSPDYVMAWNGSQWTLTKSGGPAVESWQESCCTIRTESSAFQRKNRFFPCAASLK